MSHTTSPAVEELVVLLDEDGRSVGTARKSEVHHARTPLHLAFSCYLFTEDGRLLLTRRALHKPTWPGVWTNSFCGHPGPGEDVREAVRRRAEQELGVKLASLQLTLPAFRYAATMDDGTVENELCPVFTAVADGEVTASPDEVDAVEWVDWPAFRDQVLAGEREVSPWCALQVRALAEAEEAPLRFRAGDEAELPEAARPAQRPPSR